MSSQIVVSHIVLIAIFASDVFTLLPTNTVQGNGGVINHLYLGTIDGKSFFVEAQPLRNWTEAKLFCIESGMRLASITTVQQRVLLENSYDNVTFVWNNRYWTGGRDTTTSLSRFIWDHDGETPSRTAVPNLYKVRIDECLTYINGHYDAEYCSLRTGTLCEVAHGDNE